MKLTIDVWPGGRVRVRDTIVTAKPPAKRPVPTGPKPQIKNRIVTARSPKQIKAEAKYNELKGAPASHRFQGSAHDDEGCRCNERVAEALEKQADISEMEFFGAGRDD